MAFRCDCCLFTYDTIGLLRDHLRNMVCASSPSHAAHAFVCPLCAVSPPPPSAPQLHPFPSTTATATTVISGGIPIDQTAAAIFPVGAQPFADHIDAAHAEEAAVSQQQRCGEQGLFAAAVAVSSCADATGPCSKRTDAATLSQRCAHCARPFKRAWDLRRHVRTHTDERPFACDACGRRFRLRTTLADHLRTHQEADTHAAQFQCSACAKLFLSRSALKLHMRAHTGETPFPCAHPSCTRAFRTKKLMLTHHRNEHQNISQPHTVVEGSDDGEEEEGAETDALALYHLRHTERDDAKIAFLALARLHRHQRAPNGDAGGCVIGGGASAMVTKSAINRSERSAFSDFVKHHPQQNSTHVQQHQQQNFHQQTIASSSATVSMVADASVPSASCASTARKMAQSNDGPAISGGGGGAILNNNDNDNNSGYCCWSNKFNTNPYNNPSNSGRTAFVQLQHHHHQQFSSSSSVGGAPAVPLFPHQRALTPGAATGAGLLYGMAPAATTTINASAPGAMPEARARQLLAQSCLPSLWCDGP